MGELSYLLDTHTLRWYAQSPDLLPAAVVAVIRHPNVPIYLSRVSLLEVAIKYSVGKLELKGTFQQWLSRILQIGFLALEITDQHLVELSALPLLPDHRDPFDRLLIAQALTENLTLISRDGKFGEYADLKLKWS